MNTQVQLPTREEAKEAIETHFDELYKFRENKVVGQLMVFAYMGNQLVMIPIDQDRAEEAFHALSKYQPALTQAFGNGDTQAIVVKTEPQVALAMIDGIQEDAVTDFSIELMEVLTKAVQ